jgi:hypothetical protein
MVIDEQLLESASEAARTAADADRAALLARAEYHTAVRRLHLAGASFREIAEALGISHQRVQQIVSSAGGTWWQRMWRTRTPARDAVCTFCSRPPSEVQKLVAGPEVYICDGCIARAERSLASSSAKAAFTVAKKGRAKCSFCGKRPSAERSLVSSVDASVCGACLKTCREIAAIATE